MRPIWVWNPLPQVGHMWVDVRCWMLAALALCVPCFFCAVAVLHSSAVRASVATRLCQVGRSEVTAFHEAVSIEKSFKQIFRRSLKGLQTVLLPWQKLS